MRLQVDWCSGQNSNNTMCMVVPDVEGPDSNAVNLHFMIIGYLLALLIRLCSNPLQPGLLPQESTTARPITPGIHYSQAHYPRNPPQLVLWSCEEGV